MATGKSVLLYAESILVGSVTHPTDIRQISCNILVFKYLFQHVWKDRNILFYDGHNTFYLLLYGGGPLHVLLFSTGRKEMFYLMTHSTHFIYGYMASDIW